MFCWICTANFKVGVDSKGIATVTMDFQGMKARKMKKQFTFRTQVCGGYYFEDFIMNYVHT